MTWPADIPFDPARKRYYLVEADLHRNPSDYDLLNEEEVFVLTDPFPDGKRFPIRSGAHQYQIPGRARPETYGLPRTIAKPKLFVARRNKPLDGYGFHSVRYISTRAKEFLSRIDAEAFEFLECDTRSRKSVAVEPYWMMSVIRPVDAFDEERSVFDWNRGIDGVTQEPYVGPYFSNLFDIHMRADLSEDFHAFFFPRYPLTFVFDEVLVDAWRAARFSGWTFTPLQPPAPKERTADLAGENFVYWYRARYRER